MCIRDRLNAIYIPKGVDDLKSRQKLLNDFNLEIGAGLGVLAGKVWRIGLMGSSSNKNNIEYQYIKLSCIKHAIFLNYLEYCKKIE